MVINQRAQDAIMLRKQMKTYREIGRLLGLTHAAVYSYIKRYAPELCGEVRKYHIPPSQIMYFQSAVDQCKPVKQIVEETGYTAPKVRYWLGRLKKGTYFERVMRHRSKLLKLFGKRCSQGCTAKEAGDIIEQVIGRRFSTRIVWRVLRELGIQTFKAGNRSKVK